MRKSKAKLPDPQNMPIMQFLNMSLKEMALDLHKKRTLNNELLDPTNIYPDEIEWLDTLFDIQTSLHLLLETITVGELIRYGLKHKRIAKTPGAKQSHERRLAWVMIQAFGQSPTVVWETYVLPELIKQGKIETDEQGQPDPSAVESEKAAFDKYLDRERQKIPEIPPKNTGYFGVLT